VPCGFFFLSSFLFSFFLSFFLFLLAYSQRSETGCLPYFHTLCGLSANLGCRSETCCTRLAENAGRKKSPKNRHLRTIVQLCRAISSQLRHVSTIRKKDLLSSNISSRLSHNMTNFGLLAAEIGPVVWGTPANLNSVTARHSSSGRQPNFAALNRGHHLYSAGRTSCWALAHVLVLRYHRL